MAAAAPPALSFRTYEEYLESQLTALDMYYLESEEVGRQLVELGFRGSGNVLQREEFEARALAAELTAVAPQNAKLSGIGQASAKIGLVSVWCYVKSLGPQCALFSEDRSVVGSHVDAEALKLPKFACLAETFLGYIRGKHVNPAVILIEIAPQLALFEQRHWTLSSMHTIDMSKLGKAVDGSGQPPFEKLIEITRMNRQWLHLDLYGSQSMIFPDFIRNCAVSNIRSLASVGKELKDNFLRALAEREEANCTGKISASQSLGYRAVAFIEPETGYSAVWELLEASARDFSLRVKLSPEKLGQKQANLDTPLCSHMVYPYAAVEEDIGTSRQGPPPLCYAELGFREELVSHQEDKTGEGLRFLKSFQLGTSVPGTVAFRLRQRNIQFI
ncbi:hypothetical protein Q9966_003526 [Columba livia]|nr:hypothetical protein Q9966_003526 [Columba livia]